MFHDPSKRVLPLRWADSRSLTKFRGNPPHRTISRLGNVPKPPFLSGTIVVSMRKRDERRESNESPSLFPYHLWTAKPHNEAHRDTIGAWQPDRTACCAWTGHGWGRQWWPAIRTSNGHLGAPLRCTLSSSCHRIVLATAPGVPTPQHRFADPQKLATGFQLRDR